MHTASSFIEQQFKKGKRPNRLIEEKSPYLLQHAFNPVDWYPWGEEAFQKAREQDKPIFLSVGYSTCYWCHVMERQVFENAEVSRLMNERLICIKVDREERPDIDRVYMNAVQALTGGGGWPMSVFLTHDLQPFFGGTYFPPHSQSGRPGFVDVVFRISDVWKYKRNEILSSGAQITEYLKQHNSYDHPVSVGESALHTAYEKFCQHFDALHGGFGRAPKFPRPVNLAFLFRFYARTHKQHAIDMALLTLKKMAQGGIYDHLGGGFHRYSVDDEWCIPHFEKMLYDQAQLVGTYLEAYQITLDRYYSDVAEGVLSYVLRNLTHPEGGFYSAEDAESAPDGKSPEEKKEGAFYLWTAKEIEAVLGTNFAAIVNFYYGIDNGDDALYDQGGSMTDKNILHQAHSLEATAQNFRRTPEEIQKILDSSRTKLFERRKARPRPHLDDKILSGWNGLMISAFSKAYQNLGHREHEEAAHRAAQFIMKYLYNQKSQRLLRRYRDGESRHWGTLQDYAFVVQGFLDLYEASFNVIWFEHAIMLTKKQIELFWDSAGNGFYDSDGEDGSILLRTKEDYDGAEPTGNSIAVLNLLRLSLMNNKADWLEKAEATIQTFGSRLRDSPEALPQMLAALDWYVSVPKEIIIAGDINNEDTITLLKQVHSTYTPNKIVFVVDGTSTQEQLAFHLPVIKSMPMVRGKATAYICERYSCHSPTTDPAVVAQLLSGGKNQ